MNHLVRKERKFSGLLNIRLESLARMQMIFEEFLSSSFTLMDLIFIVKKPNLNKNKVTGFEYMYILCEVTSIRNLKKK